MLYALLDADREGVYFLFTIASPDWDLEQSATEKNIDIYSHIIQFNFLKAIVVVYSFNLNDQKDV